MEFEVTSLWNRETFCIFALEFKDPMAAQSNIAKSHFSDAFFSKSSDGNPWSDTFFCARYNRKTTFPFTSKERDRETGFFYFGARYYDSDLSGLFLSVDPMSDKYPILSSYAYCAWNPVKLVDPNDMEISIHIDQDGNVVAVFNDGDNGVYQHQRNADGSNVTGYQLSKRAVKDGSSCGGVRIGETEYWDEFNMEMKKNI